MRSSVVALLFLCDAASTQLSNTSNGQATTASFTAVHKDGHRHKEHIRNNRTGDHGSLFVKGKHQAHQPFIVSQTDEHRKDEVMKARSKAPRIRSIHDSSHKWDGRRRRPTRRVRPSGIKASDSPKGWGTEAENIFFKSFFASGELFDWGLFALAVVAFLSINSIVGKWNTNLTSQCFTFVVWMMLGAAYNLAIFVRLGEEQGLLWLDGFLLELIFSMENVFVFHIIVEAFSTPVRPVRKALFVVICCQNVYDMVLYMGLATWLDSLILLPYLLGVWLVYVGFQAVGDNHDSIGDIMHTAPVTLCRSVLGSRLSLQYDAESPSTVFMHRKDGVLQLSLLGLVIFCLLLADFVLEIDVTLTKIESLQDQYISFTSSAAASFAMPALFFLVRDLFDRFSLLKYGIAFVLIFFGVQMLFCSVFRLSPLEGCGIIMVVMVFCILASPAKKPVIHKGCDEACNAADYGSASDASEIPNQAWNIPHYGSASEAEDRKQICNDVAEPESSPMTLQRSPTTKHFRADA